MIPFLALETATGRSRYRHDVEMAFCILLCWLSFTARLGDLQNFCGIYESHISTVLNDILCHMSVRFGDMLFWDSARMTGQILLEYNAAIENFAGGGRV